MQLFTTLLPLLAVLPSLAFSAPVITERADKDWSLLNIAVWQAVQPGSGARYIDFTFRDNRSRFTFTTDCRRVLLPTDSGSLTDGQKYSCEDPSVEFAYDGTQFALQRTYTDTKVGPPGMDSVTAFGSSPATLNTADKRCGKLGKLNELDFNIQSMIAK